ncbi:MAG: hypothetical protein OXU61_08415 [Gammaproteobacteria bacterium]|nr:hypothetical protein [Gammaproteobacteria bacterium]
MSNPPFPILKSCVRRTLPPPAIIKGRNPERRPPRIASYAWH